MAITNINAGAASAINGLSPSVAVNTWGLAADDVLVAIACSVAATDPTISSAAGGAFTDGGLGKKLNSTSSMAVRYMYHRVVAGSVPTAVVSVNSGAATDSACLVVMAFRGVKPVGSPLCAVTLAATGSSTNPDSPAITPSENQACIVIAAATPIRDTSPSGLILNYLPATPTNTNGNDTFATTAAMAYRILTAGGGASENPPAFNSWTTSAWVACTMALSDALTGTLGATEAADTAVFTGLAGAFGTLGATETADTAAFPGLVGRIGTLSTTEAADTAVFAGDVAWLGVLSTTEAPDDAVFSGLVGRIGALSTTEDPDTALFAGDVAWEGVLNTTEDPDVAVFTGTVSAAAGVTGVLDAFEDPDTAVIDGITGVLGTLATVEDPDTMVMSGMAGVIGVLAAIEAADDMLLYEDNPNQRTGVLHLGQYMQQQERLAKKPRLKP